VSERNPFGSDIRLPSLPRPPRLRTPARLPRGPKLYTQPVKRTGGPGEPPPGFVTAQTSASEWHLYWAFARVFDDPEDPRKPSPLTGQWDGGRDWAYQNPFSGGRRTGGQVSDFVAYLGGAAVVVRLQSLQFHVFADARQQARDDLLKLDIAEAYTVVDIFEQDFIADATGQAAIVLVKDALRGIEATSPLAAGTGREARA
jgi:hypothetical protein